MRPLRETPFDQSRYQVRVDWGHEGLERLAPADIVVLVDVLGVSTTAVDAVGAAETHPLDEHVDDGGEGMLLARAAAGTGATVIAASLRNASAAAEAILAEQTRRGARTSIGIVAAGERGEHGGTRFAVEDQLGAGALIDALADRGIDHTSPEAAATCEAFRGLRRAVRHLLTASGSGLALIDLGRRDEVLHAAEIDAATAVPVLRDGVFVTP